MMRRKKQHRVNSERGGLGCFHRAIRQHGFDSFSWSVLELCDIHQLVRRESYWIRDKQSASVDGFNTVANPNDSRHIHREVNPVTRLRISRALTGKTLTDATRLKISIAGKGRPCSDETRAKLRASRIGKTFSPDMISKLRLINTGSKHTEEHKLKISQALIGVPKSKEHCDSFRKRKLSKESIEKRTATRKRNQTIMQHAE